jgi:Uma2 family endonuclease
MSTLTVDATDYLQAISTLPTGGTLILEDVSWDDYEWLLAELSEESHYRLSYDEGRLEIMSPSKRHEIYKSLLSSLLEVLVEELGLRFLKLGSTTLRRKRAKGTEPDECFYLTNLELIAQKDELDLSVDPPPDLAIEVDISHRSDTKFAIYAALGVPEVWRYRKGKMQFYRLAGNRYIEIAASDLFPFLPPEKLTEILEQEYVFDFAAVKKNFRKWVRANKPS